MFDDWLESNPEAPHAQGLAQAVSALKEATNWVAANGLEDPEQAAAAATPYLRLTALTMIGYLWSRMAVVAATQKENGQGNEVVIEGKIQSARFYFDKVLPETGALLADITSGKEGIMSLSAASM